MINIEHLELRHLDAVIMLAGASSDFLAPNTRMIYYLGCTLYAPYSLIALDGDAPVGYLFAMPEVDAGYVWLHQIAVHPQNRREGVASQLLKRFEGIVAADPRFDLVRCAIKTVNVASKGLFRRHGFRFARLEPYVDMEIFEKSLR